MGVRLVDLTQEIYQGMPVFPLHQPTFIFPNITHEESERRIGFPFATNNLLINEHGPTHSDAPYEYDPQGKTIDEMPLEYFCGPCICLDVSHVSPDAFITRRDLEEAVARTGLPLQKGDIVLLHTGHFRRAYGTEEWLTRYTGLDEEAAGWLAENGVVNIGVDAPSIDKPDDPRFSGHRICRKFGITNTENLCNLDQVVNRRFLYVGLPLKIRKGTGSPIRAVAVLVE
ncbi:MAG: cyclase family protein [Kyrpidia sp.]|nr:cyclase family protein [Kyrpidia sp.]